MDEAVKQKLAEKCNEQETYLEFIRDSEQHLGLQQMDFYGWNIKILDDYIEELDYLWTK